MNDLLSTLDIALDTAMLVLIWLVQCIIYPAFREIAPNRFKVWHGGYMRTISIFVIPLMLMQAALTALATFYAPDPGQIISLVGIATAWAITFSVSAPCHQKLQRVGKDRATIERINHTNWLRTGAWTIVWIAGLSL